MGIYARTIFPWMCDLALDQPLVAEQRRRLLRGVAGEVLEIGFGTGLNLPCYPASVRRVTAVDPNPGMHRRARRRIEQSEIEVERRVMSSERLPLDDATFDVAVSTFTLCSIERVDCALAELYRVLKPGGRLLFLEHGVSPDAAVQKWQRRLNPIQRLLADNCRLDRPIRQLVARQPFTSVEADEFYLERTPKTHGYLYRGAAVK